MPGLAHVVALGRGTGVGAPAAVTAPAIKAVASAAATAMAGVGRVLIVRLLLSGAAGCRVLVADWMTGFAFGSGIFELSPQGFTARGSHVPAGTRRAMLRGMDVGATGHAGLLGGVDKLGLDRVERGVRRRECRDVSPVRRRDHKFKDTVRIGFGII